jgi:AcrR family transcriptional regulator
MERIFAGSRPMARTKGIKISDIVDAALEECMERGYEGLTMEGIAERAGIHYTTLIYHVGTKEAILTAVRDRIFEPAQVIMNVASDKGALDGLRYFLREYLSFWAKHPREREFYLVGVIKMLEKRAWWPQTNVYTSAMVNWFDAMLYRAVKEKQLPPHDTRARAVALFCAVEGAVPYLAMAKTFSLKKTTARLEKVLIDELVRES